MGNIALELINRKLKVQRNESNIDRTLGINSRDENNAKLRPEIIFMRYNEKK